ncbi:MAG: PIG-L family deacetylase [Deltaproteobacteria bacterium]|nr:PIG-L family deacetylase [Deltaproteobacteria bacterium]
MNILAIGAHPDDIEIGCAGAIMKYRKSGHRVYLLIISDGSMGGNVKIRRKEQEDAARIMKVDKIFWGGFKDTGLENKGKELIDTIEGVLKKIKPTFIFVNYPKDTHQDHRLLADAAISATRHTRNVLFYEVPTSVDFNPTVFVDISKFMKKKVKALTAHVSQVHRTNIEGLSIIEIAKSSAHFRGTHGRVKYAEGFIPLRLFMNV